MSKKILNTKMVINELKGQSVFFQREPSPQHLRSESESVTETPNAANLVEQPIEEHTTKVTRNSTQKRDVSRDPSRDDPRETSLPEPRSLPTRDEIQEFSFRLRDDLKVKVQAEVPHQWQKELEEVARKLDVKKLELYRYIFGAFLGKVKRK